MDADSPPDVAALLRSAGLRVTSPRRRVLGWLEHHPHSTADAVWAGVRGQPASVSRQAIYDVLRACEDAGLVRSIQPAGHAARYERRVHDNHHHLVCQSCGRTEDVDCAVGASPCLTPSDHRGFDIAQSEVLFWGLCPDCGHRRRPETAPAAQTPVPHGG